MRHSVAYFGLRVLNYFGGNKNDKRKKARDYFYLC